MKGKLLVIEGSDGAGKATQLRLLADHLTSTHTSYATLDFPQYDTSFFGNWIGRFLNGDFGKLEDIPPYLVAFPYAADRWQAKDELLAWLASGKLVLTNRYAPSNAVYQGAKLTGAERDRFVKWCFEMEYEIFQIPREDLVIYLHVPVSVSLDLITKKSARSYLKNGSKQDIHEANKTLLTTVEEMYLKLARQFDHWVKIECCEGEHILPKEVIQDKIREVLSIRGILT